MNRHITVLLFLTLIARPVVAWADPALIVGEVRDQRGDPIVAARVVADVHDAYRGERTITAADGTFVLHDVHIYGVTIGCDYCQTTTAAIAYGKSATLAIVVRRYDSLLSDMPSKDDIENLPYATIESALALHPFTVLEDSRGVLPGPLLSDRGLSSQGGLVAFGGIAEYDPVANVSPFYSLPYFYGSSASELPPAQAFRVGDQAGAGTFLVSPFGDIGAGALALAGGESAVGARSTMASDEFATGGSSGLDDTRERGDASETFSLGDGSLNISALGARSASEETARTLETSFAAAQATYTDNRTPLQASFSTDRGTYGIGSQYVPGSAAWSDVTADAHYNANDSPGVFADLGFRHSSGYYDVSSNAFPNVAANETLFNGDAGFALNSALANMQAGAGFFDAAYAGGAAGSVERANAALVVPSIEVRLLPQGRWSILLNSGGSFRLPTVLETYAELPDDSPLTYDRNALLSATAQYTDFSRVRIEATAARERVAGLDNGEVSAVGLDVAWQIAPLVTLRTWELHFDDATLPYEPVLRFGASPQPATVGSAWLTYETSAVRIDAIWRRDLLDYAYDEHLDASLSAPLVDRVRWFVGTECRHFVRVISAGLRLSP